MCSLKFAGNVRVRTVDQSEVNRCCAELGVDASVSRDALERIYLKQNFALIRSGSTGQRERLREAYEKLANYLETQRTASAVSRTDSPLREAENPGSAGRPIPIHQPRGPDVVHEKLNPFSFDSRLVNIVALPLVALFAWLLNLSPFVFFLRGFHIWVHEFGHATVAWLVGKRALPLPIGWTNVEGDKSNFVYFGVLFLLGVLLVAGWKERKIWPVLIAFAVAPLQFYMTWHMPEYRADMWLSFGGVGGEFYLSTLLMALFYVQFPEKFKWSFCRYFFLFLGASAFLNVYFFWRRVKRGTESIPWGSMVQGEEDGGGDMNVLRDVYHWSNHDIIGTYTELGNVCLLGLLIVYLAFALRVDRLANRMLGAVWSG
jgi:hypothetical protein